jgi:hypothetical protein
MIIEAGRETADLLEGRGDRGNPMDGVREVLAYNRQASELLFKAKNVSTARKLSGLISAEVKAAVLLVPKGTPASQRVQPDADWVTNLGQAADSVLASCPAEGALDAGEVQRSWFAFAQQMSAARANAQATVVEARWSLDSMLNVIVVTLAERVGARLADSPDLAGMGLDLAILKLTANLPEPPGAADDVSLGDFWSTQKATAFDLLASVQAKELDARMGRSLSAALTSFVKSAGASADPQQIRRDAWQLADTLRAYGVAVDEVVTSNPSAAARLHALLDGISLRLDHLLALVDGTEGRWL